MLFALDKCKCALITANISIYYNNTIIFICHMFLRCINKCMGKTSLKRVLFED